MSNSLSHRPLKAALASMRDGRRVGMCVCLAVALCTSLAVAQYPGETSTFGTAAGNWVRWAPSRAATLYRDTSTLEALGHLQRRKDTVDAFGLNATAWKQRRETVREALNSTVFRGLPPLAHVSPSLREAAWPLNTNITKSWVHPTLNFTVHMLYFESRPGFFVTAGLWVPHSDTPGADPVTGKRAGVLYASGHSCQAWRRRDEPDVYTYQYQLLHLVKKGFVVLSYDPPSQGERGMYWTGSCSLSGGCTRRSLVGGCEFDLHTGLLTPWSGASTVEHDYYARQLLLNNVTDASVWLFDGLRAMDLLASRTDLVDPARLGMAGCSGGGTQTMYLSAFDGRVAASSTACYASDFAVDFTWQGAADGEQQWPGAMPSLLNKADLSVARVPLATQYCITTNDACFPAQGGRLCVADAGLAFAALGAPGNLSAVEAEGPHGMMNKTRRGVYSFFQTTLQRMPVPDPDEDPSLINALVPMPALIATHTGSVVDDLNSRTIHDLATDYTTANVESVAARRTADAKAFIAGISAAAIAASGYRSASPAAATRYPLPEARFLGKITDTAPFARGSWVEKWVLQSEGVCGVAITLYLPPVNGSGDAAHGGVPPATPQRDVLVVVMSDSFASVGPPSGPPLAYTTVTAALRRGLGVACVSLCGFGEMGPSNASDVPNFWTPESGNLAQFNGRSTPGFHAGELTRAYGWLESRADVRSVVGVVASNHTDAAVLHAVAIDPAMQRGGLALVAVVAGVARYEDVAASKLYSAPVLIDVPGVLAAYDLPDLAAAWLAGAAARDSESRTAQQRPQQRKPPRLLLLGPVDAMLVPLNTPTASRVYNFASETATRVGGSVDIVTGTLSAEEVVQAVFAALPE